MKDNKRKLSPLLFVLIGLVISALLGMLASQLLLDESPLYLEKRYWRYTALFYFLTMMYTFWIYGTEKYLPVVINLLKFLGVNILLSLPYFTTLVLTGAVPLNIVLTMLPAQVISLAALFIWHVACELDPELEQSANKIWLKAILMGAIAMFTTVFFDLPDIIDMPLFALTMLVYMLLILSRAKKNKMLKSTTEQTENKEEQTTLIS